MSVQLSLGTKKKSYPSIKAAAMAQAQVTGEPVGRVYIRMWKRLNAGSKPATAMRKAARKYVRKGNTIN